MNEQCHDGIKECPRYNQLDISRISRNNPCCITDQDIFKKGLPKSE